MAFTRNPATGEAVFYGEYLDNAQGEDVVSGVRTPHSLEFLKKNYPQIYKELDGYQKKLEKHHRDMQDIEFTVESVGAAAGVCVCGCFVYVNNKSHSC